MAQPYSDDLRCKLLQAYTAGKGTLEELAERFGVSYGYSKKIRQQQLRNHQMERIPQSYPRQGKLSEEKREQLKKWVRERPDRTLAELQSLLWEQSKLRVSLPPIWEALRKMGLRLKKNSTRRSRTRNESNKRGQLSSKRSSRSIAGS